MSLLGLLTIGRTFGGVRSKPASYRVSEGLLPDFGPGREHAAAEAVEEALLFGHARPDQTDAGAVRENMLFDEPAREMNAIQSVRPESSIRPQPPAVSEFQPKPLRPVRSRRGRGVLVQGELSISTVRVVRNDLSADDLELIPRRLSVGVGDAGRRAPAQASWRGWLAHWRQWFRAGRS